MEQVVSTRKKSWPDISLAVWSGMECGAIQWKEPDICLTVGMKLWGCGTMLSNGKRLWPDICLAPQLQL
jgi:hypothetical protein